LALERRHEARTLTRATLGAGVGVAIVENTVPSQVYGLEAGARQQLTLGFGVSAHFGFGVGAFQSVPQGTFDSTYIDVWGNLNPYFGPFGRFYVGPALTLGHRHFSDSNPGGGAHSVTGASRTHIEGGTRFGVLFGDREQFDLWFQGASSLGSATRIAISMGFNFEFM